MRYDLAKFDSDKKYFSNILKKERFGKSVLLVFDISDEKAFFSIAPLSSVLHDLKKDVAAFDSNKESVIVLRNFWEYADAARKGVRNEGTRALSQFLNLAFQKTKGEFGKLTAPPDAVLIAKKGKWYFLSSEDFIARRNGRLIFDARSSWLKKNKWPLLNKTTTILWRSLYNLSKSEVASCGFDLIPPKNIMKKPLVDYLDSFQIAYSMALSAGRLCRRVTMAASTPKEKMDDFPERVSDLSAALFGCELEKEIDEDIFRKFAALSKFIGSSALRPADAVFAIKGEGYSGKHIFGQYIGYPTKNKKSRWQAPGQMLYKLPWYPQTKDEERKPRSRLAITDTIPLDIFIETNYIDWDALERRNRKIMAIINRGDRIIVKGKKTRFGQTDFIAELIGKNSKRRYPLSSGTDVREKIDRDFLKQGIVAGSYGNIPGGEAFLTPEFIKGTFIGDVVISIDRSYLIPKNAPLLIRCDEHGYKILSGDKKIIAKINAEKNASLKELLSMEKNGAIPHSLVKLKKDNFNKIGELAINTNPKARLCDYLIVNEKIANMMHIALGSGFDADRSSTYHFDIVFNAKDQGMDVYCESSKKQGKKKEWILRNGHFVV